MRIEKVDTTLSGRTYVRMISAWQASGFTVKLIFLALATPEEAIARVAIRVAQGGHDVPPDTIGRRFASGLRNFLDVYRQGVDYWQWFDNGGDMPLLLEEGGDS